MYGNGSAQKVWSSLNNISSLSINRHYNPMMTMEASRDERMSLEEIKLRTFAYDSLKRIPLLLVLIPHCLKFYLLFFYYAKFRLGLSRFLKIRFYVNMNMLLSATMRRRGNKSSRKFSSNPSSSHHHEQQQQQSPDTSEMTSLSLRPRFRPICCCCLLDLVGCTDPSNRFLLGLYILEIKLRNFILRYFLLLIKFVYESLSFNLTYL